MIMGGRVRIANVSNVKSLVVGQGFQNARNHGGSHDLKANRPGRVLVGDGVVFFCSRFIKEAPRKTKNIENVITEKSMLYMNM